MPQVQVDVGLAYGELHPAGRVRLDPPLNDLLEIALRGIHKRGEGTDVEGQGFAAWDGVDTLVRLPDVPGEDDVHLAEHGSGIDRLDVVIDELSADCLYDRIEPETLGHDWHLDVLTVHACSACLAAGIEVLREPVRVMPHRLLFGHPVDGSERRVGDEGRVVLEGVQGRDVAPDEDLQLTDVDELRGIRNDRGQKPLVLLVAL